MIRTLTAFALLSSVALAQEPSDQSDYTKMLESYEAKTFQDGDLELPYRILTPADADDGAERPLLLFLHGFGERGDDNGRQLVHGGSTFASEAFQSAHPCFVVAPQCPGGNKPDSDEPIVWSLRLRPTSSNAELDIAQPMTAPMHAVRELVDHLVETLPIDKSRLYVAGLSMGGYGTWELAAREPEFWAAAAPICGGGSPAWGERLTGLPLWAFHGGADGVVPPERSRDMIRAINEAGGRAIYTEYSGVGHDSWTATFESQQAWDWLFAQHR